MTQQLSRQVKELIYVIHVLFEHPSIVLIGGTWKYGKTDFALYLSEWMRRIRSWNGDYAIVSEVASNIDTSGTYPYITDLISLRQWLYGSRRRKLYVFDEASEHLPSRRSMSAKSVGFMQLIPEISKAHARMIVVGHQLLAIDKTLLDQTWCRGVFLKTELKTAQLISLLLSRPYEFTDVPRTSIKFDPYVLAPFTEKPEGEVYFKESDKQMLWDWANGKTFKELGLHPMSLNRKLRKYVRNSLEKEVHTSHT